MRAAWISNSGHSILRVTPSTSRTIGRVDWKSTNSSGSITANGSAPRLPARNVSAEVADSPASFQPLKAQTSAGARSPSGRRSQRSGCMDSPYRVRGVRAVSVHRRRARQPGHDRRPAGRRRGRRRLRLLAQGPAAGALRRAVSRARAARPHGRDAGARVPRRRPARRALRARRSRARGRPGGSLPRRAADRGARRSRAPRRPTRRRSCPSPTATWTSSTASSSTWRARSTTRLTAACWSGCSATAHCGRSGAAPRARGRPPRLPRRPAGAHGRGRHARARMRASCTRV